MEITAILINRPSTLLTDQVQIASCANIGMRNSRLGGCLIEKRRFATASHLVSWAGLCPKNDESAGKRRSTKMRKGAPWLKTTLVQCATAALKKKNSYYQAQFHRLRCRRGAKKAICAVAASMLTTTYHMLKDGTCYQDPGHDYFDRRAKSRQTKRLVTRLENLGYAVQITPMAA